MNKLDLLRIIVKDLEEIKILSEEAAATKKNPSLIVELALSKSRLLGQEIELLRDFILQEIIQEKDPENNFVDQEEDDSSQPGVADPELEIINFEIQENEDPENEVPEEVQTIDPDEDIAEGEEDVAEPESEEETPELDEPEVEIEDDADDLPDEDEEEKTVPEDDEDLDEDVEEEILLELDEDEEGEDDLTDEDEEEIEEPETEQKVELTELNTDPQPGVREIHIDDLDDDDIEPLRFSPVSEPFTRPVMREIPKPEEPVQEKMVVGEKFQKERSVNDVIAENKTGESKLTNGPISSLRAAIGLNDRFLFIREIFENNSDKYNSIIDQLDKLETIQQAVDYLKANLTLQKNETSMKFVDLLKRRFTK